MKMMIKNILMHIRYIKTVFKLQEPGTFVGLHSPPNAIESFFIAQILSKGLAEKT